MSSSKRFSSIWVCALIIGSALAFESCSDSPVTPQKEGYSIRPPVKSLSSAFDQYQFLGFVLDDQGANDTPAQSDLNAFTRADNVSGKIGVEWVWDDINSWTGSGQTGDACALFDTDNDGKANAAVCVRITNPNGDPNLIAQLDSPASPLVYSCGDNKNDRCAQPANLKPLAGTHCEVEKIPGETFFSAGEDGADVLAACSIPNTAISATSTPNLINVCSFPSGSPNSNPFDCVVTPGAGFLVIKKATVPQSSGLTFNFKVSPRVVLDSLFSLKDSTSGVEQTALLSATPGTSYSVGEGTIPTGWSLASAACLRQTSPTATATGTKTGNTINNVTITSGETTECTFTNQVVAPTITVAKSATPDSIPETGGSVTYGILVTNTAAISVTLDSLKDNVFGDLNGQGTCNHTGNLYGVMAPSGTYSCSFSKTLAASNAGQKHINHVTAYVSSDGGPATATDSAVVRYTDVKPSISVTKSADTDTITASGGTSVAGFTADAIFARGASGGGGGSLVFAANTCDDAGANDQPAQVDLNCFTRADNVSGHLGLRWTWDDINAWTGSGQTGDACALLDTDSNGKANYALCVSVNNPNGDPTQVAQVAGSPILYKCKDVAGSGQPDRCATKFLIQSLTNSSCTVSIVPDQIAGGEDGADTQANCDLALSDIGSVTTSIQLLNVCSYPSGSPNSNPFDCVVTPAAGFLVIHEITTPGSDAYFAFTLRNGTNSANATTTDGNSLFAVEGGATSAQLPVLPGTYGLPQQMPANWTRTSISCTGGGTDTTGLNITIVSGQTTTCTYNNTLTTSRTVTFTVTVTNNSLEDVSLFSLEDTENPDATTPTYTSLNSVGTCATGGTIVNGTPYSCTFTRTVSGTPGTTHNDKVRAVGKDNELNSDSKMSSKVTVTIN